ncbi:MAG: hypothetical protein AAF086_02195 [Planctomycetota bacterium]
MAALLYKLNVNSPCVGEQLVTMTTPGFYAGASGTFTYGLLFLPSSTGPWRATIYDRSGGPCTPQVDFEQVTADPNDPLGAYQAIGPSGPDPSLGELSVNLFP